MHAFSIARLYSQYSHLSQDLHCRINRNVWALSVYIYTHAPRYIHDHQWYICIFFDTFCFSFFSSVLFWSCTLAFPNLLSSRRSFIETSDLETIDRVTNWPWHVRSGAISSRVLGRRWRWWRCLGEIPVPMEVYIHDLVDLFCILYFFFPKERNRRRRRKKK